MFLYVLSFAVLCSLYSSCLPPHRTLFLSKYFREQASSTVSFLGDSLGGLQLTIRLCGQHYWAKTTQQAAAAVKTNRPGRKQETGRRRRQDIRIIKVLSMTSRKRHSLMKNTWSEAKYSVAVLWSHLRSNTFLSMFYLCVFLLLSFCASVFSVCLFSPHTDTVFQTAPSSQTSNPTLFSVRIKEGKKKKKNTRIFHLNIHQRQPHETRDKKKNTKAQTFQRANRRRRDTHTHTSQTHSTCWQTNTQRNSKQKAQPEDDFMQRYSKVCFTVQLNIKAWYIPLWSLTPQWTNPIHPHPLTAYRESCWTSPLITR